jgi:hypothetical protein
MNDTAATHTLTATILNVTDDSRPDMVTVEMPEQVVDNVTTATTVDIAGVSTVITNATATNDEITMTVLPDSDANFCDVTVTTGFTARRASN